MAQHGIPSPRQQPPGLAACRNPAPDQANRQGLAGPRGPWRSHQCAITSITSQAPAAEASRATRRPASPRGRRSRRTGGCLGVDDEDRSGDDPEHRSVAATVMARRLRTKTISTTRPPNWAAPLITPRPRWPARRPPAARRAGPRRGEHALAERHDQGEEDDGDRAGAPVEPGVFRRGGRRGGRGTEASAASRRARPIQCTGRHTTRLMRANSTRVCRQPTCWSSAWPTTQNTDEAKAPRPIASSATMKPRKTKPRLQPVSWLIGPARTPRQ
jgi:hypothetical protein